VNLLRSFNAWRRPAQRRQTGVAAAPPKHYIDLALRVQGKLYVAGWCNADMSLALIVDGQPVAARQVNLERDDVARAGVARPPSGRPHGFALVADQAAAGAQVVLRMTPAPKGAAITVAIDPIGLADLGQRRLGVLGEVLPDLLSGMLDGPLDPVALACHFQDSPAPPPEVTGGLDVLAGDVQTGRGFAVGWLQVGRRSVAWMEGPGETQVFPLAGAFRTHRDDITLVQKDLPGGQAGIDLVFTLPLQGVATGQTWRLKVMTDRGVFTVGQLQAKGLPANPLQAYRSLAGLGVPLSRVAARVALVDWQLVAPMMDAWQAQLAAMPVEVHDVGVRPAQPLVSVIVPLYGRLDFVEPQLMKFSADPWFRAHAELVYVVDDPSLVEAFRALAPTAAALYGVGFRWTWGGANRGFSGANNLGTAASSAATLVFVNSDVFPIQPGWAAALRAVLQAHPQIGAVGPRLLHADGSVQHAGIQVQRREDLGIWINHHPCKGVEAALDPVRTLSTVPAVTGACLAVRRQDLEAVGGWDTGYLAGDFEDTDLCFKLREKGLGTAYQPAVEMTHLERQSFGGLGDGGFRTQLAILNAVRHQQRWEGTLQALASAQPVPLPVAEGGAA
jgi:GT2 family glycosyltransferase